jgi:hypothetical protein
MGVEAGIQGDVGSGHHTRSAETTSNDADKRALELAERAGEERGPTMVQVEERSGWKTRLVEWASGPWNRLLKLRNGNGHLEPAPELMETRDEEADSLEDLVPNLPEGHITFEELQAGLGALSSIIIKKEQDMSALNVISPHPGACEKALELFESALGRLKESGLSDNDTIQVMSSPFGIIIAAVPTEERKSSHLSLFGEIEFDERIAQIRRGYLLSDPLLLINCFEGEQQESVRRNPLMAERRKRLQWVINVVAQRFRHDVGRSVSTHYNRTAPERLAAIKEQQEKAPPIHPDILAMFADQVTHPEESVPYADGVSMHVAEQRLRLDAWLDGREELKAKRAPILGKLPPAKTEWQQMLDGAYQINTFGPSMLNAVHPKAMLYGLIQEYVAEHVGESPEAILHDLSQLGLRDLLMRKGFAGMRSSGWMSRSGLMQEEGKYKEAPQLKPEERDIFDEYMIGMRIPRDEMAYGMAEFLMWKDLDLSQVTAESLKKERETLAGRCKFGLKLRPEDYLNFLSQRAVESLSRDTGQIVSDWDQFFGALLEDPSTSRLFTDLDTKTSLWRDNLKSIAKVYHRAYVCSEDPEEKKLGKLMVTALMLPSDKTIDPQKKARILDQVRRMAQEIQAQKSDDERMDEAAISAAGKKRFSRVTHPLTNILQGGNRVTEFSKTAKVADAYATQLINTAMAMLRGGLLWDERFFGKLDHSVTFYPDEPNLFRQLRMVEKRNGLIIPVQQDGKWVFVYPYKMAPWTG